MKERNLFEIPIYRTDGEDLKRAYEFRRDREKTFSNFLGIVREVRPVFPGRRYNDVVGWIVLSIWHGRIRAEYWFVDQRVIIGLRNKSFENRGKLFTYRFRSSEKDSEVIFKELSALFKRSVSEQFPKRQVDFECFESIGPYIDWKQLLEIYASNKALQVDAAKPRA